MAMQGGFAQAECCLDFRGGRASSSCKHFVKLIEGNTAMVMVGIFLPLPNPQCGDVKMVHVVLYLVAVEGTCHPRKGSVGARPPGSSNPHEFQSAASFGVLG